MKIHDVLTRGVEQILPSREGLLETIEKKKIRLYLGIDPTGNQLHLGHGVVLRKLQQFCDLGHHVILLIGNGTVRIGDPTGRDASRPQLTDEQIMENFKTWKQQASKVLDFSKIEIKKNGDWLDKLSFADIVKLMAQTTVQQLIERDMFQDRIKKKLPIFGHEIIYPLLQGYDSVAMDVDLEVGGTDQTFNMMMGRQLQKSMRGREKFVLTTPIINGLDGRKMSKSFNNFVGLAEEPEQIFGKLMSLSDDQIISYFEVLTDVPTNEIAEMKQDLAAGTNPMILKKRLAHTITAWLNTEEAANAAEDHFERTVQNKEMPSSIPTLSLGKIPHTALNIVVLAKPDMSKSAARRLIEQGGVVIDGDKHHNPIDEVTIHEGSIIRIGKREYFKLKLK